MTQITSEQIFSEAAKEYRRYSELLASLKESLLKIEFDIDQINGRIEHVIAFDSSLKNDLQRKASISALQASDPKWTDLTKQSFALRARIIETEAYQAIAKYTLRFYSKSAE